MPERIQTVRQLKEWLKAFSDRDSVWGIQGQPLVSEVTCRHAEARMIIEVPGLEQQSWAVAASAAMKAGALAPIQSWYSLSFC